MVVTTKSQLELRANLQRRNPLAKMWCTVTIYFVLHAGRAERRVALSTAPRRRDHGL